LERTEADVDEEVVRAVDGARDHRVGLAAREHVARLRHRVEGARARSVERVHGPTETERLRHEVRGQAREEAIARVDVDLRRERRSLEPHARGVGRQVIGGEREVAHDRADARKGRVRARIAQELPTHGAQPARERIETIELGLADREIGRRLDLLGDVAAAVRPRAIAVRAIDRRDHPIVRDAPSTARDARGRVASLEHEIREGPRARGSGQETGAADDRDGHEFRSRTGRIRHGGR
jgi:hypothetical protein